MAFPGGRKSENNSEGLDPQAQVGRKKLSVIQIIVQQISINLTWSTVRHEFNGTPILLKTWLCTSGRPHFGRNNGVCLPPHRAEAVSHPGNFAAWTEILEPQFYSPSTVD